MDLIELHILQSFPVSCLNRDDVGSPKTAFFGGCQRARVSSQAWKRAIRTLAIQNAPEWYGGRRTRFIIQTLEQLFSEADLSPVEAKQLALATADSIGRLDSKVKNKVKIFLYFSNNELNNVAQAVLNSKYQSSLQHLMDDSQPSASKEKALKELKKITDKASKKLKNKVKDAADIAIFGRMVAVDHSLMVEGAGLFSHALSTHAVVNEIDFFSAVDDNQPADDGGAGHIGAIEFNSACYYRYVGLNLDLLQDKKHLGHFSPSELRQVTTTFLKASLMAAPRARQNAMFGITPPAYVLGLRRTGQPLSLVNAFEVPILSTKGFIDESRKAMEAHWSLLSRTYNLDDRVQVETHLPDQNIDKFIKRLLLEEQPNG